MHRIEDLVDTVVAMRRASWVQDGVYLGPRTLAPAYRDLLHCARVLESPVPPAIAAGCSLSEQGTYGTDGRAFLYLSTYFLEPASQGERRFFIGQCMGHIVAKQATASTLYQLLSDQKGLRSTAQKAVGPLFEVLLAPLSLAVRLALSRWHRAAQVSADRAGLLAAGDLEEAGRCLLRLRLGKSSSFDVDTYLQQLKTHRTDQSPGRWAELLNQAPWTHKRIEAMRVFRHSARWAALTGEPVLNPHDDQELARRTAAIVGVG